ncbi:hypothetical protein [Enterobacter quasiroggenkampii]|uniref:hypothetical protein n=1 Tax=Enterobacter quasiroggenkampii TaxID=2497436 RepID=UPI0021D20696|nr:hypothetical protein [Enterobacter quasiroggenkampii]MCU6345971.1 hypothetical protein [Enterobacter quasiroggenkampii]
MKTSLIRCLATALLLCSSAAGAASVDITASYGPGNNQFIETTPNNNIGYIGLELGLTSSTNEPMNAGEGFSINGPGASKVVVLRHENYSDEHALTFRVRSVSSWIQSYHVPENTSTTALNTWTHGSLLSIPSSSACPRGSGDSGGTTSGNVAKFYWPTPNNNIQCNYVSAVDREFYFKEFTRTGVRYEIQYPDPQKMNAGVYRGSITYSVGTGMDFDFGGSKFTNSDTQMTFNFILTVAHGLKLTTTEADQNVSLQPCEPGKVCTAEKGKANWERWSVTQITPQLTGKSGFTLSHSGGNFTAYLQCEYPEGDYCAIKSDKDGRRIPVQTQLTLPAVMVDSNTGAQVINRPLKAGRDTLSNLFRTANAVGEQGGSGHIDFLVKQQDVDTMLKTRPDTYRGAVTVIFDVEL